MHYKLNFAQSTLLHPLKRKKWNIMLGPQLSPSPRTLQLVVARGPLMKPSLVNGMGLKRSEHGVWMLPFTDRGTIAMIF